MNETCLPFWWPCDSHSYAHSQGVSMAAGEHGTVSSQSGWSAGPEMEPWGDVCLSQDHSSALSPFFWPWQQPGKHAPDCNEHREAFLKREQGGLNAEVYEERGRVAVWLFLISPGLVNYIVQALLLKQVNIGVFRSGCSVVSCCPLLASEAPTRTHKYWHMT